MKETAGLHEQVNELRERVNSLKADLADGERKRRGQFATLKAGCIVFTIVILTQSRYARAAAEEIPRFQSGRFFEGDDEEGY